MRFNVEIECENSIIWQHLRCRRNQIFLVERKIIRNNVKLAIEAKRENPAACIQMITTRKVPIGDGKWGSCTQMKILFSTPNVSRASDRVRVAEPGSLKGEEISEQKTRTACGCEFWKWNRQRKKMYFGPVLPVWRRSSSETRIRINSETEILVKVAQVIKKDALER